MNIIFYKKIVVILLFFLITFSINFNFLPVSCLVIIFSVALLYFLYLLIKKHKFLINKKLFYFQMFFLVQIILYCITYVFSNSNEISQLQIIFVFYVVYPIISLFIIKFFLNNQSKNTIIRLFLIAIFTQAVLSIIVTFSPEFRNLAFSLLNVDLDRLSQSANVRFVGFGIAYFNLGTVMVLGLLLSVYLIKNKYKSDNVFYIPVLLFALFLFILLGVFSARVSILGIIIILLMYLYTTNIFKINKNTFSHVVTLALSLMFLTIILYLFIPSYTLFNLDSFFDKSIPWAFEMFNNLLNGNRLQSDSTDDLSKMFFLPKNSFTMLFGDARMYDGDLYYMHTDVGYIRQIFSYGILGLTVSIISYTYLCNIIRKYFDSFLAISLFFLILIFNIKGIFIYYSNFDFFIIFIFVYIIINEQPKPNKLVS